MQSDLKDVDLVLKGGGASGVVYAEAVAALASRYRFRRITGASIGAVAAAFAGAAEYARQQGDPHGFERLRRWCAGLPEALDGFLVTSWRFAPLLDAILTLAPGSARRRGGLVMAKLWLPLMAGAALALAGLGLFYRLVEAPLAVAAPGLLLAGVMGALAGLGAYLALLLRSAAKHHFGLMTGAASAPGRQSLVDWINDGLQHVAFGDEQRSPLTFGDLERAGVELRVVTTELVACVPQIAPFFPLGTRFDRPTWLRLLPRAVLAELPGDTLPPPDRLPVLVAVRMSMAAPGLLAAMPAVASAPSEGGANTARLYSDGGLSWNFPFDVAGDGVSDRPVFALELSTRPTSADPAVRPGAEAPDDEPLFSIDGVGAFLWAVLAAMRDARSRHGSTQPERRDQIWQVRLLRTEGGMNIREASGQFDRLAAYGRRLGGAINERRGADR